MKTLILSIATVLLTGFTYAQEPAQGEDPDTLVMNFGTKKVLVISPKEEAVVVDTVDASPSKEEWDDIKAHWGGLEFGPTILMNESMNTDFKNNPYWENDPAHSFAWNLNFAEHKFKIYRNNVGITVGLGVNWTQIGLRQYRLQQTADTIYGVYDSITTYSKNKLTGIYLTAPLMLELCSNGDGDDKGFYLSVGVIGGVRIASNTKYQIEDNKSDTNNKTKGAYALNAFRADAAVKMGYGHFGLFANYGMIPLFDTGKTVAVHPLTLGLTYNF